MSVIRAASAEAAGTALLLAVVVGSGIMGERLAAGNAAIALLANAIATGAGLYVLIVAFAPISGAHFNPVVSLVSAWEGKLRPGECAAYLAVQVAGAFAGVWAAHAMFELPLLQVSTHLRPTPGEGLGEAVATFGLVLTIGLTSRFRPQSVAAAVACFITSAYWFTSSTSFANPAVTLARAASNTFAGIAPQSVPVFLLAQLGGGLVAALFTRWLRR
jgi:glycerol uptake facilitator-like aquaporin